MAAKIYLKKLRFIFFVTLMFITGIYGAYRQHYLSISPINVRPINNYFIITKINTDSPNAQAKLTPGDTILAVNNEILRSPLTLKKIADTHKAGSQIPITFLKNGKIKVTNLYLTSKYKNHFVALNISIAVMFYLIGIFVYISQPLLTPAKIFSWACIVVGTTLLIFWRNYPYHHQIIEYFLSGFYLLIYSLVPGLILYFSVTYPHKAGFFKNSKYPVLKLFSPGFLILILLEIRYFIFIKTDTLNDFIYYLRVYDIFRMYFIVYLMLAVFFMIKSYREAATANDKKRMQWLLWALIIGLFPFIFLWTIFLAVGINPVFSEFLNYPFMLLIPIGFAISIVKYKVMDIEVIISKSIVYTLLTGSIVFFYLLITFIAGLITQSIRPSANNLVNILITLSIAIILIPLRDKLKIFVDKIFYRTKHNYQIMREDFSEMLAQACNPDALIDMTLKKIQSIFQIDKILLMLPKPNTSRLAVSRQIGFTPSEIKFIEIDTTGRASPEKTGVYLTLPVILDNSFAGILLLGKKMSRLSYSEKDVNLMLPFIRDGLIALDRLRLRQAMIIEHTENKRLQEISNMKSEFIASVSHELRTPVALVYMSVTNLLKGIPEKPSEKILEYLKNMRERTLILKNMIEDLLDITKIEAGKIVISPRPINLLSSVESAVIVLSPMLAEHNISISINIDKSIWVKADKISIQRILTNLIENGIKFSEESTAIEITAKKMNKNRVSISIIDHGHGIPSDRLDSIFDKFLQIHDKDKIRQKGLGLGLYITKKLVELHSGTINVESNSKGSTFMFTLPETTDRF